MSSSVKEEEVKEEVIVVDDDDIDMSAADTDVEEGQVDESQLDCRKERGRKKLGNADLTIAFFDERGGDEVAAAGPAYKLDSKGVQTYEPVEVGTNQAKKRKVRRKNVINIKCLLYFTVFYPIFNG